ncbi:MAG: carbonic anhydrase [Halobacteriota archaeon]
MQPVIVDLLAANGLHAERFQSRFDDVQHGQHPEAVTVCCSDSRVLQDHLWGNDEPGRLFTCSTIGNRVVQRTDDGVVVSGDVLYPIHHADTELVIVVGHTGCGAVAATHDAIADGSDEPPGIDHCIGLLRPLLEPGVAALPDNLDRTATVNRLVEYNVDRQVESLLGSEDLPSGVSVVGVVYDFQDVYGGRRGEVHVINVDGTRDVDRLRSEWPDIAPRVRRLWAY